MSTQQLGTLEELPQDYRDDMTAADFAAESSSLAVTMCAVMMMSRTTF